MRAPNWPPFILTRNPVTVDDTADRFDQRVRVSYPDEKRTLWHSNGKWVIQDHFTQKWSIISQGEALSWLVRNNHEQAAKALLKDRGVKYFEEGPMSWPSIGEWEHFSIRLKDGSGIASFTVFPRRAEHWFTPAGVNSTDGPGARRLTARAAARLIISKGPQDWAGQLRTQPWVWQGDLSRYGGEPWGEGRLGLVIDRISRSVTALPIPGGAE